MIYTVVDIETTGLNKAYDDIIQFAYMMLDENLNVIRSEILYMYYPEMRDSTEGALNLHGLTRDFLKQYEKDFETNVRKMYSILARSNVITHNGDSFDIPFCRIWLSKFEMPDVTIENSFDTIKIYQPIYKRKMKLTKLVMELGYKPEDIQLLTKLHFGYEGNAHDAGYDVTATMVCFIEACRNRYTQLVGVNAPVVEEPKTEVIDMDAVEEDVAFFVIEDEEGMFVVNTTSDKKKYPQMRMPYASALQVTGPIHDAIDQKIVFKKNNAGNYEAMIAPTVKMILVNTEESMTTEIEVI